MKQLNLHDYVHIRQVPVLARELYEAVLHDSPVLLDLTGCDSNDCGWIQFLLGPPYLDFGEQRVRAAIRVQIPQGHKALRAWFTQEVQALPTLFTLRRKTGVAVEFFPGLSGQPPACGDHRSD